MASPGLDLPPPYSTLDSDWLPSYNTIIENAKATRQALDTTPAGVHAPRRQQNYTPLNATEVTIPQSHDTPGIYGIMFKHKDDRIKFIQKVLAIKFLQTLAVTLFMIIFVAPPFEIYRVMEYDYKYYNTRNSIIVVSSVVLVLIIMLIHVCGDAAYVAPLNYMFLVIYPLSFAFFASVVTLGWAFTEFFVSWVHFNIVVLVLLLYSVQTKIEFETSLSLVITGGVFIIAYVLTGTFAIIIYGTSVFNVLYCSLMMFALTAYMLMDIQAMISKSYRIHITPSNFVKAAVIMHIDYCYMIMKLFSKQRTVSHDNDQTFDDAA